MPALCYTSFSNLAIFAGHFQFSLSRCVNLCGLEKLDEKEMDTLQVFIDFLISRKDAKGISEGGL